MFQSSYSFIQHIFVDHTQESLTIYIIEGQCNSDPTKTQVSYMFEFR